MKGYCPECDPEDQTYELYQKLDTRWIAVAWWNAEGRRWDVGIDDYKPGKDIYCNGPVSHRPLKLGRITKYSIYPLDERVMEVLL